MNAEMTRALIADGEKLLGETGVDHGPWCPACNGTGEGDAGDCPCAECHGTGRLKGSIHDPDYQLKQRMEADDDASCGN